MIHSLAKRTASIFILYGESSAEDADIYTYACEAVIATMFNIIVSLVISFIFGRFLEGVVFISVFALLRRYTEGYHAKTHFKCIFTFNCILICAMVLLSVIPALQYAGVITLIASAIAGMGIIGLALTQQTSNISRYLVLVLCMFCIADVYIINNQKSRAVSLAMLSVFGSMAFAFTYNRVCDRKEYDAL